MDFKENLEQIKYLDMENCRNLFKIGLDNKSLILATQLFDKLKYQLVNDLGGLVKVINDLIDDLVCSTSKENQTLNTSEKHLNDLMHTCMMKSHDLTDDFEEYNIELKSDVMLEYISL